MNEQKKSDSSTSLSFIRSFFLFTAILLLSSAPVLIEQANNPKRIASNLLSHIRTWQVANTSKGNENEWETSDGFTAKHVSSKSISGGIEITLGATQAATREAFFSEEAITTGVFKLTTEVNTPKDCHNGLVFRGNAQGEYYLFLVSASSYTVEILRRDFSNDLPREAIIPNEPIPKIIGEPRTISVLSDGRHYLFYINDALVNGMDDSRLKGNRIGVEVFT
jgi:hypothetical protein